jgi:hypothetical protein
MEKTFPGNYGYLVFNSIGEVIRLGLNHVQHSITPVLQNSGNLLTLEQSDIQKSSFFNLQPSIPACPGWEGGDVHKNILAFWGTINF